MRRGIAVQIFLTLWQRESKQSCPEKVLYVKFIGESDIDSGAMSKEFSMKAIPE